MANSAPTTPRSQFPSPSPRTDSPGNWKHPRFQEIQRRKNAAVFGERHLKRALWNGGALIASFFLSDYLHTFFLYVSSLIRTEVPYAIWILRFYFLVNVGLAFTPFLSRPDTISDIPLTPSQRVLLGLDPSVPSPSTPGNDYITPPKYRLSAGSPRNQTPQSGRSVSSPLSGSPLSGRGSSPTPFRTAARGDSSASPNASPLLHKTYSSGTQDKDIGRRLTFGSPSSGGLGRSLSLKESNSSFKLSGTPSPTGRGKGGNGGLNYKWLYEKGAQSPSRRESFFS